MDRQSRIEALEAQPHHTAELCRGSVGAVGLCSCGHLHLSLQYLTLRFEPAAFRELVELLEFAQRRIDADSGLQPSRPDPDAAPVH